MFTDRRPLRAEEQPRPRCVTHQQRDGEEIKKDTNLCQLPVVLLHESSVDGNFGRSESRRGDKFQGRFSRSKMRSTGGSPFSMKGDGSSFYSSFLSSLRS